jgi:hypothetical protein
LAKYILNTLFCIDLNPKSLNLNLLMYLSGKLSLNIEFDFEKLGKEEADTTSP